MDHPTPLYNAAAWWARFRRLSPGKQIGLVVLNGLGLLLLLAACLYGAQPETASLTQMDIQPAVDGSQPPTAPILAGQFVLSGSALGATVMTLHQFGDELTGIATSATCDHGMLHTTQRIITGQVLPGDQVRLTFTNPDQPHSVTLVYHLVTLASGLTLSWADATGHTQSQHWQRELGETALAPRCPR